MRNDLNIRDEEMLLPGLCLLSFDADQTAKLKALAEKITDWRYFASLAGNHGVSALVYSNLAKLGFLEYIPSEITNSLWNAFMMNIGRNASFTARIKIII